LLNRKERRRSKFCFGKRTLTIGPRQNRVNVSKVNLVKNCSNPTQRSTRGVTLKGPQQSRVQKTERRFRNTLGEKKTRRDWKVPGGCYKMNIEGIREKNDPHVSSKTK